VPTSSVGICKLYVVQGVQEQGPSLIVFRLPCHLTPFRSDVVLGRILEVLAPRLPTAALVAALPDWLAYAREIVAAPTAHKQRLWPLLRMCLAFADSVPWQGSEEGRKLRREFQVLLAGRTRCERKRES